MGLGIKEDDDGDGDAGDCKNGGKSFGSVSCSICLELVTDNGDRSWAKLQCGHQFHLDCVGSAFNIKGAMQCPNCRKIEKGQWLYATGYRSFPDFSTDDWTHDEDLYDLSYSEMSFGVHWCPFGSLTQLPSSFEEGEFSSNAYHDLPGQQAIFAEHSAISSSTHPCPYVAYFGPIHPSSSNISGSVSDNSNFNNPWNGPSIHSEMPTPYTFPAMDLHYHSWEQHSSPFPTSGSQIGSSDQTLIPHITQRSARTNSDIPRPGSFMHPFLVSHSARAGGSVASSMIPPYPGSNARARDRVQALQAYYQQRQPGNPQAMRTPVPSVRRSGGHRGVSHAEPVASSSDQNGGFYFFPQGTSGRSFQEVENPPSSRFLAWEREHLPPFSFNQVDRDSSWGAFHQAASGSDSVLRHSSSSWGAFHQAASGSDSVLRHSSLRRRHVSERTSSQNQS